ncbi:MAG: glutathione synthase, partial [Albidovulum sp.]|nr:glutathione synthase [Albidovulum sp.]
MPLKVAFQMDPIEAIDISADSTFRILLEAQSRGHELWYYTPEKLAIREGTVSARARPLSVRNRLGDHFT